MRDLTYIDDTDVFFNTFKEEFIRMFFNLGSCYVSPLRTQFQNFKILGVKKIIIDKKNKTKKRGQYFDFSNKKIKKVLD